MQTVLTAIEWYLIVGFLFSAVGAGIDVVRNRVIADPTDFFLTMLLYPFICCVIYRMWKRGELQ